MDLASLRCSFELKCQERLMDRTQFLHWCPDFRKGGVENKSFFFFISKKVGFMKQGNSTAP